MDEYVSCPGIFISAVSVSKISLGIALLPKGKRKSGLARAAGLTILNPWNPS